MNIDFAEPTYNVREGQTVTVGVDLDVVSIPGVQYDILVTVQVQEGSECTRKLT